MPIQNKLKEIRMREYMESSSQFAKRLEIPLTTYSQLENSKRSVSLERAFDIAKKLNKNVNEIWFE